MTHSRPSSFCLFLLGASSARVPRAPPPRTPLAHRFRFSRLRLPPTRRPRPRSPRVDSVAFPSVRFSNFSKFPFPRQQKNCKRAHKCKKGFSRNGKKVSHKSTEMKNKIKGSHQKSSAEDGGVEQKKIELRLEPP